MMGTISFVLLFFLVCECALPPGWEDELYCRPDHCLQPTRKHIPRGYSGSVRMFNECCNMTDPRQSRPTIAWGEKVGKHKKEQLLSHGYHTEKCADNSPCARYVARSVLHTTVFKMLAKFNQFLDDTVFH